jgi:hypothetical protein
VPGTAGTAPQAETGLQITAGQPVQPRATFGLDSYLASVLGPSQVLHGVMLEGGDFSDALHFNPVITGVITQQVNLANATEWTYPVPEWDPALPLSLNRFLSIDGLHQRLVVLPGAFSATASTVQTTGTERTYQDLQLSVFTAPFSAMDVVPPSFQLVNAVFTSDGPTTGTFTAHFTVQAEDNSGSVARVLLLYAPLRGGTHWAPLDLVSQGNGTFTGAVSGLHGSIVYFVQAADPTGNVAVGLDHGRPFLALLPGAPVPSPLQPFITPQVIGNQLSTGRFSGPITVTWQVSGNGSPITTETGCGPVSFPSVPPAGLTLTCSAQNAGGQVSYPLSLAGLGPIAPPTVTTTPAPTQSLSLPVVPQATATPVPAPPTSTPPPPVSVPATATSTPTTTPGYPSATPTFTPTAPPGRRPVPTATPTPYYNGG